MRAAAELVNINENTSAAADGDAAASGDESVECLELLVKLARKRPTRCNTNNRRSENNKPNNKRITTASKGPWNCVMTDRRKRNDGVRLQIVADSMDAGRQQRRRLYFPVNSRDEPAGRSL